MDWLRRAFFSFRVRSLRLFIQETSEGRTSLKAKGEAGLLVEGDLIFLALFIAVMFLMWKSRKEANEAQNKE